MDRQVDTNWVSMSMCTWQAVASGRTLQTLSGKLSVILFREDGIDQAKFKCPRILQKAHAHDTLWRPALHVQGVWAHGFGFHFAVADADMFKNTNNNIEVFARAMEKIYRRHKGMPQTLTLIQDNTARECKNSKILKFFIKLVLLDVVEHVHLGYPVKGHSHGPLDAVYGQCCVKIQNSEFDNPHGVVDVLQGFLDEATFDGGAEAEKTAYKLDEAADWEPWWDEVRLDLTSLTGPRAPHWFHICALKNLDIAEKDCKVTAWPGAPASHMEDIVMAVKDRMASTETYQVALLVPGSELPVWRRHATEQPSGLHPRRVIKPEEKDKIIRSATACYRQKLLSKEAFSFLTGWAQSTLRREPRPPVYTFLSHRCSPKHELQSRGQYRSTADLPLRPVQVAPLPAMWGQEDGAEGDEAASEEEALVEM